MAERAKITTDKALLALNEPGKIYSDSIKGTGLYLFVTKSATRRWLFVYSRDGKRREMGLGLVDGPKAISLKDARNQARSYQATLALGGDPWSEVKKQIAKTAEVQTFGGFADEFIAEQAKGFRNAKHIAQWKMTMNVYAKRLRPLSLDKIDTADVLAVLKPIWLTKPETAKRTQGRIERILDAAKARGLRSEKTPPDGVGILICYWPARISYRVAITRRSPMSKCRSSSRFCGSRRRCRHWRWNSLSSPPPGRAK